MTTCFEPRCARRFAVVCLGLVLSVSAARAADEATRPLALEGYCPIRIVDTREWEPGRRDVTTIYDGRRYRFTSDEAKRAFQEHPERYVPALGGDCVVTFAKNGERKSGSIDFGLFYEQRLYLFAGESERRTFKASGKYDEADLAFDGLSAVRLFDDGERVDGRDEFTAHLDGLRYRFAGELDRAEFLANPKKYRDGTPAAAAALESTLITVVGTSACAVCDYGVRPIRNRNTLGMVVRGGNGTIYVIEDADERYPRLYADRFDHGRVRVRGRELKRRGRFVWLDPESLESAS